MGEEEEEEEDIVTNWIMEFLIQTSIPDSLIHKTLASLPLSSANSRLKKTILLRILQSQLINASLSETSLEILETLEELYRNDGFLVPDAMRSAYCAIAVDCTVKLLIVSPQEPSGEYFSAVRRIWRGSVARLEANRCGLFSDELLKWGEKVESALWDVGVSERIVSCNTRNDAMNAVKIYLKEAWEIVGSRFLRERNLRLEGVCEIASGGEMLERVDGRVDRSGKEKMHCVDDGNSDNAEMRENHGNGQLKERVGTSDDPNQEVGGCDSHEGDKEIQNGNAQFKRKYSAVPKCHRGVKISNANEVRPTNLSSKDQILPSAEVNKVKESLKSSSVELKALVKDPLPDTLHTSEVVRSKLATKDINLGQPSENQSGNADVRDSNACMTIVLYQPNDANLANESSVPCSNDQPNDANLANESSVPCSNDCLPHPSLMDRIGSARTYEWNDSIENLSPGSQPRKKRRKWTTLEEETLRAGVKMFGEGNWTTIREFYSNIFEYRTAVDLKDKWRNMMR